MTFELKRHYCRGEVRRESERERETRAAYWSHEHMLENSKERRLGVVDG